MEFSTLLIALCSITLTYFLLFKSKKKGSKEAAPRALPSTAVGNIFQLGTKPHQSLAQLAKTHGPLMSLHFGSVYTVIITSPAMAREVFVKNGQDFLNRTVVEAVHAHDHDKISMAFMDVGAEWRALRRIHQEQIFSSQSLESSQGLRQEKLQQLRMYVQSCCNAGRVVDIREASFVTTLNLMSAPLFSIQATEFDSKATEEFREIMEGVASIVGDPNFADYFPILKSFDPQGVKRKAEFYDTSIASPSTQVEGRQEEHEQDDEQAVLNCDTNERVEEERRDEGRSSRPQRRVRPPRKFEDFIPHS